jgi:peptidoglycan/xylan/chitin deacetylase (PgdA/CDA1 family)
MMPYDVRRDFIGYGANPPNPKWPNGARIAVNFVMNYEEGSEPSMQDGEGHTEIGLTDAGRMGQTIQGRDLAGEGLFEYGSRVGFWRLMRLFQERNLPMTIATPTPRPQSPRRASTSARMDTAGSSTTNSAKPRSASISARPSPRSRR